MNVQDFQLDGYKNIQTNPGSTGELRELSLLARLPVLLHGADHSDAPSFAERLRGSIRITILHTGGRHLFFQGDFKAAASYNHVGPFGDITTRVKNTSSRVRIATEIYLKKYYQEIEYRKTTECPLGNNWEDASYIPISNYLINPSNALHSDFVTTTVLLTVYESSYGLILIACDSNYFTGNRWFELDVGFAYLVEKLFLHDDEEYLIDSLAARSHRVSANTHRAARKGWHTLSFRDFPYYPRRLDEIHYSNMDEYHKCNRCFFKKKYYFGE
ncbi:hypothetical protein FWD07_00195 [Candidatus Saccharibacteria bacterium]|nr:hypothetical protein [Candidatus Saccharibacteria bacterium]